MPGRRIEWVPITNLFFLCVIYFAFLNYIFIWKIIGLQNCVSCINMNQPQVYICSLPLEPPLPLPPYPTPLGGDRALGLSSQHHTANSHWLSVLHMVMYMFQCFSVGEDAHGRWRPCTSIVMSNNQKRN